jgi:CheY-like chemotaxis protein
VTVSRSVLLIEDNEQNRYLVTFLLEHHGYEVVSVADGARAIEMARTFVPRLIMLDIQLPTMDGYAVARALRRNEALVHTPIVAVTSYAMPGDREKALEAGCSAYLEKPINPATFVAELEQVLSRSPSPEDREDAGPPEAKDGP